MRIVMRSHPEQHSTEARLSGERQGDGISTPLGVIGLVILLLVGFAVLPRFFKPRDAAMVGGAAPDFTLPVVANEHPLAKNKPLLALSELRGNAVLLDFWATWCGPCRAEMPILDKVAQRYRDRGLIVVGVNTDDDEGNALPWITAHNIHYPIVFDDARAAGNHYKIQNLPTLILVSREGKVLAVRVGMTDAAELESLVEKAL
jgi:thiol-disulfide isomerase/thioredoxin